MIEALRALVEESRRHATVVLQAAREKLFLTTVFLLLLSPYIIWLAVQSRKKTAMIDTEAPFVYVMR